MYGDPENHDLKLQLAKKHAVQSENIVVGEGIDGLLGYLCRLFIEPGDRVVSSLGAYPTFNFHVAGYGGQLAEFCERWDQASFDPSYESFPLEYFEPMSYSQYKIKIVLMASQELVNSTF